jgi:uncharacterized membrane protein
MEDVPGLNEIPGDKPKPAPPAAPAPAPASPAAKPVDFAMNRPTIIALLYIASFLTGITGLVGVVLAYVWRAEPQAEWETSHYQYLINTFWLGLVGSVICIVLMVVLIGFLLIWAVLALVVIRTVLSLVNAQKQQPMPNPGSWTI